ncbi:PTS sugar transporter subunit IIA, partial [Clostridium chrysemydis]|uniref:PTS sugar transporter subunit IIA n=1 Tax=Clostridium chrysemydis TaxID=2665504 RepID=UPI003F381F48
SEENKIEKVDNLNETNETKSLIKRSVVYGCTSGELIKLSDIKDKAFSSGALGKGVGINANSNLIVSPIEGEIVSIFPTKHAFGLKSKDGVELLIHIGINTVELDGENFELLAKVSDKVEVGTPLVKVDFNKIKEQGYDTTVVMVVTNSYEFMDVIPSEANKIDEKNECLKVIL